MFLKDCNGTFRVFVWMKCLRLMKMDYCAEHTNNKWLFGHIWWDFMEQISHLLSNWDSWECLLMKIIKGKWIFIVLFLTLLTPKWWIFLWLFWDLSAVLRLCFFHKVFLKSDTVLALTSHGIGDGCVPLGQKPEKMQCGKFKKLYKNQIVIKSHM